MNLRFIRATVPVDVTVVPHTPAVIAHTGSTSPNTLFNTFEPCHNPSDSLTHATLSSCDPKPTTHAKIHLWQVALSTEKLLRKRSIVLIVRSAT